MSRRHRRHSDDAVQPDLPITPMLDMSFQLLAFFIMTFNPVPTEGQIAMSLPPPDTGGPSANPPSVSDEKPMKWAVVVAATDNGQIAKMTLREEGGPDEKTEDLGASVATGFLPKMKALADAEKRRIAAAAAEKRTIPPPKLTLEVADKLVHAWVVQLMDAAVQAGFTDIAPVPIDKKSR
jgi:biopolymer transport protein ExbD